MVNYDVARDIDTHTHRVGRTGRAGEKGTAYTLITSKDKDFAGHLVRNLEGANQCVPHELMDIAMQVSLLVLRGCQSVTVTNHISTLCLKENVPPLQLAIIFTYTVRLGQFLAQMLPRK